MNLLSILAPLFALAFTASSCAYFAKRFEDTDKPFDVGMVIFFFFLSLVNIVNFLYNVMN